jgi:hypothetical protein
MGTSSFKIFARIGETPVCGIARVQLILLDYIRLNNMPLPQLPPVWPWVCIAKHLSGEAISRFYCRVEERLIYYLCICNEPMQ